MEWYELVGVIFGPGGAVYVGMKGALNGMKHDIAEIKADVRDVRDWHLESRGK